MPKNTPKSKNKKIAKPRSTKSPSGKTSSPPTNPYVFANPKVTPDNYLQFSKGDLLGDSAVKESPNLVPFPPSRKPEVLSLQQVLGDSQISQITAAKSIVFHCVGDTGGIKEPSKQFAVADAMAADLTGKTYQNGKPAFFYLLGDIVYYFGQEQYYYDQFYDPYRNYDAPIFAIPGNHDGVLSPTLKLKTLAGFLDNFCTSAPTNNPEAQGFARTTMTQPGAYFTLDAPFVKIIGLYSNTSESASQGVISGKLVGMNQLTFLQQQLQTAAQQRKSGDVRALIVAVHHPPFTASAEYVPSPNVLNDIDAACKAANIMPDMVLSGHVHAYERYTRYVGGNQIPFVVAGMGGYFNLIGFSKTGSKPPAIGTTGTDVNGNKLTFEAYADTTFGFLRVTVSANALHCVFVTVDWTTGKIGQMDPFTLDLNRHTVSGS